MSDLDVRWFYNYKDEDDNETQDTVDVGEFIEIDANVVGTVQYSAEYFRDQCPSQQDTISIEILQMADTLKTDTMVICRNYKLTKSDIIEQIREWNGSRYNENNLLFYQYDNTYASTDSANIAHAISQDSLGIERLINSLDFTSDCVGDYRIENFVVQAMNDMPYNMKSPYTGNDTTYQGCPGAGSIVPIKILCYKDDQPIFAGGVDSILYCTGDVALTELNSYLEEPAEFDVTAHKWAWARVGSSETLPKNGYKSTEYKTRTSGKNPETSTDGANVALFAVVRIDSNSCVSKSDTFRIVVADAIKSYAKVGDTTSVISTSRTDKLPLNFCKGENPYKDKTIPTVGYPSRDYIMEWFRKDKLDDDCDDIAENHYDRLSNTVDVDFDHVDTTYYCLRQTTDMGCKGPWLTVIVTVNDSVRETQQPTPSQCVKVRLLKNS
ncbi:MAG: hypothetical protein J6T83_05480 [Paludibacteraceae bacterium]|nr:hypothetical protein [Paludibacteraceae bacterium]